MAIKYYKNTIRKLINHYCNKYFKNHKLEPDMSVIK